MRPRHKAAENDGAQSATQILDYSFNEAAA